MQERGLLHRLDFLSSVSGGGYCCSGWLSHVHAQMGKIPAPRTVAELEKILSKGVTSFVTQLEHGKSRNIIGSEKNRTPYIGMGFFSETLLTLGGMTLWYIFALTTMIYLIYYAVLPVIYFTPLCYLAELMDAHACELQLIQVGDFPCNHFLTYVSRRSEGQLTCFMLS